MALGARVLRLSHHGTSASLPSRATIDISWYSCGRRLAHVALLVLRSSLAAASALRDLDRWINDVSANVALCFLDPLRMLDFVERLARLVTHLLARPSP
eukprot:3846226-Pleurochrysis_carterae.AAC.1